MLASKMNNGCIDGNYATKLLKKPFEQAMLAEKPLEANNSFISKMFIKYNAICLMMMRKYIQNPKNPHDKRQALFNFILSSMTQRKQADIIKPTGPYAGNYLMRQKVPVVRAGYVLSNFNDKKYYDESSKKIICKLLLTGKLSGSALFLIDAADIYGNQKIFNFLLKHANNCKEWKRKKPESWFALLILGHHGNSVALKKIKKIAETPVKDRHRQVFSMPLQLAYVQNNEIVDLLKQFLKSKESYFNGGDAIPQSASLSHSAAIALNSMIADFPPFSFGSRFTEQDCQRCLDWFKEHKKYKFRKHGIFSHRIQYVLYEF
jgi:hypothetical protein